LHPTDTHAILTKRANTMFVATVTGTIYLASISMVVAADLWYRYHVRQLRLAMEKCERLHSSQDPGTADSRS
jgi:hypothetical protein